MKISKNKLEKPIDFKSKEIDDNILALKLSDAINETIDYIFKNKFTITSIVNGQDIMNTESHILHRNRYMSPFLNIYFENVVITNEYLNWHNRSQKVYSHSLEYNPRISSSNLLKVSTNSPNWYSSGIFDFMDFTVRRSKKLKKKIIKAVYIFESDMDDNRRYNTIFNFLTNRLNIHIIREVINKNDDTKLDIYIEKHELKAFYKTPTPLEVRNSKIKNILR